MAVSAFKSSSRRNNITTPPSSSSASTIPNNNGRRSPEISAKRQTAPRRSRSVSAFSRTSSDVSSASLDFLNKRDNPLFSATPSPPDLDNPAPLVAPTGARPSTASADNRRGRSVARNDNAALGARKEFSRTTSRVDSGRRNRSVSRCPAPRKHYVNSESEAEQECSSVKSFGSKNLNLEVCIDNETKSLVRTGSSNQLKGLRTWSSQHSDIEPSQDSAVSLFCSHPTTWDDGVSTSSSLLGVEEKTIKAVCEQMKSSDRGDSMTGDATSSGIYETVRSEVRRAISEIQNDLEKAIRRNNTSSIAISNIADIPPDLVNPSAVELVLDIRREYAEKLDQSQERARQLRGDLAVEEHRGQELSRILKDVLPDPNSSNVPKSRPGRKTSIERRKMSKRLTEEAMSYFDECVSLSTFDSSDFSSPEDLPVNTVGFAPVDNSVLSLQASSSTSPTNYTSSFFKDKQESGIQHEAAELMASSSNKDSTLDQSSPPTGTNEARGWKSQSQFSFVRKATETPELQQDIQKYIRNSEKGIKKGVLNSQFVRSNGCDLGEYELRATAQSFVFERMVMRNRIESGSLLLCNGGSPLPFSPFASFV
ncbi:uncharacterized protein LOC133797615 [Humulus lupulus]|uniref:uncharacterized protein LOC133797615 n=1 Tax=Humulus lupulus TaxID=3486 RepID=UPI002B400592|nr:uncharacterized protein LOC133797615 [Humulus lupulus]